MEVKIRQVREGQLIAHRQRAQRHGRVVREKNSIHQKEFDELIESYSERCNYYVDELKHLESTLPAQESLAALQGQEGKCKKKVQGFREECEEALEELSLSVSEQPHKLFQLSASLLKAKASHRAHQAHPVGGLLHRWRHAGVGEPRGDP